MPGYRPIKKYSEAQEGEFRMRALGVLATAQEAMNIDAIKARDMVLSPLSSQKMSRVLGRLVEMGCVQKSKSKSTGRMMYKATSVMEEQGYEVAAP